MQRRGFTFVDLMVGLAIVVFLLALVVPLVRLQSTERSNRFKCASNLSMLGRAIKMYANDDVRSFAYPRGVFKEGAPPVAYTNPTAPNPFKPGGPGPNDVTVEQFLLLRTQDIASDVFICPSTGGVPWQPQQVTQTAQNFSNFASQANLTYSVQNAYPTVQAIQNGFRYDDVLTADFAIMSDMNPGSPEVLTITDASPQSDIAKANSPNHGFDGQNVLYADGHVEWSNTPFCGVQRDNIFAHRARPLTGKGGTFAVPTGGIMGPSADGNDSVLLPAWDPNIPMPAKGISITMILLIGGIVGLVLLVVAAVVIGLLIARRKRPPAPPAGMPPLPMQ